jgi:dTDP-4-amino-4,6-dideoxygalactose transaminase
LKNGASSTKRLSAAPKPRAQYLPFHLPSIDDADVNGVVETLRSGWLTTGPKTKQFEQAFASYVGAKHAVAVNSCTAGLHVAMAALDMQPGDEVITTPYTFVASVETIVSAGGKPVLVDVDPVSLNIEPRNIERAMTSRTRAIVPVHFAGRPADMDPIMAIGKSRGVPVIEDAAHSLPASYKGRTIGTIGDCTVFSFYATKNLTTGEGGMITTASEEMETRMRRLSLHGMSRDAWKRYAQGGAWFYEVLDLGFKYNMMDIQASLGLTQLPRLEEYAVRRDEIVARYREQLGDLEEIELPESPTDARHAWHLYVLRLRPEKLKIGRDEFIQKLNEMQIGVSVHFIPVHLHPYYRDRLSLAPEDLPVALSNYKRALSLPIYPRMTNEDVDYVADAVRWIVEDNRR